jgi:hypothetical protein
MIQATDFTEQRKSQVQNTSIALFLYIEQR